MNDIQQLTVNSIRVLSAEAIDKANSGHPGLPLGSAAIGYTLFANNLVHNPKDPAFSTATALCSARVTARCSCIRFCTFSVTDLRWTISSRSVR